MQSREEIERRKNSFEPRMGTAQLVFGIIYGFMAGVGIVLAIYTFINSQHRIPWTQVAFCALFLVLAGKSFFLYAQVRILYMNGRHTIAKVESIVPERGITIVSGSVKLKDGSEIQIESRLAGESCASELENFLRDQRTRNLPALVVNESKRPRGMFVIRTHAGHLDPQYRNQLVVDRKN
jgi:hypothetical protein